MGPVWDFDLAFGVHYKAKSPTDWFIQKKYWYSYLLQDSSIDSVKNIFWIHNKHEFSQIPNTIDSLQLILSRSARNNFKKWKILNSTDNPFLANTYDSYEQATSDLKYWIIDRLKWINEQIEP